MTVWKYTDSKYKTMSPTGELKFSGARKLGWKGSDIRVSASKIRINSLIMSGYLEYKVPIERGGQYQAHRLFLP